MIQGKVIIQSELGLHLRPASDLCRLAMLFPCEIKLKSGNKEVNVKSILGLLSAQIKQGDCVELVCDGDEEAKAYDVVMDALTKDYKQYEG